MTLRFTSVPGLEDVCETELRERLHIDGPRSRHDGFEVTGLDLRPQGLDGHVLLYVTGPDAEAELRTVVFGLRSCFHVIRHVALLPMDPVDPLGALDAALRRLDIGEMRDAVRFRVTSQRSGEHTFRSMEAQRAAGAALLESYGAMVDLEEYDTEVRVDAVQDKWLIGVQWTREALDKRYPWVYRPRVTLRTTVAYGLLRMAGLAGSHPDGLTLLDPFCGSGTVLVEAARAFPRLRCLGADREPEAVAGTRANARAVGVADQVDVREADARDLEVTYPLRSVDYVVTNPPYGIRLGRTTDYRDLYRKFLRGAASVVKPKGRVVVLVGKRRHAFNQVIRETTEFSIVTVRVIEMGGVYPAVFVLRRR
ncbi:MAG: methyltransferase domain-containing protein [Spirochaetaceae bacterium]